MSVVAVYLIFSMLAVIWFDATRYIIPNWLVGMMLVSFPVAVLMARVNVDWQLAVAGMALTLAVGYIVFLKRLMGGGDIKLITACALWVGHQNILDFLCIVAILGGIFAVAVWCIRKGILLLPAKLSAMKLPRILREGEPLPYGVAIALGFLIMMWDGKVPVIL